jgi:hypothetical protein
LCISALIDVLMHSRGTGARSAVVDLVNGTLGEGGHPTSARDERLTASLVHTVSNIATVEAQS